MSGEKEFQQATRIPQEVEFQQDTAIPLDEEIHDSKIPHDTQYQQDTKIFLGTEFGQHSNISQEAGLQKNTTIHKEAEFYDTKKTLEAQFQHDPKISIDAALLLRTPYMQAPEKADGTQILQSAEVAKGRNFKQGICGCCTNCDSFLGSCFFPCIELGYIAEKLGENFYLFCCLDLIAPWFPVIYLRETIREQRNIEGSLAEDTLLGVCCYCCTVSQMATVFLFFISGT
ncbi:hypothetical protein RF11_14225 [Thelohanellus kitauei]|uniref:Uncharacterized protein n=1 Tax=Thelohanellus kitauei TaxID=669202 RepID=A0A0C2ILN0_THEKT|nr:hypothetical protein RF11_14225 [Thelohanellus kitauei]